MSIIRSTNILFPPFKSRLEHGLNLCRQAGHQVYPFETWRSSRRQGELYAQGRTTPGPIVTKARPGESFHQYACAADLVFDGDPDKPGVQWSWTSGSYKSVAKIMSAVGLESVPGDSPHWQLTGGLSVHEAERLLDSGGLPLVWLEIERRLIAKGII